jgi:hypothetical protein
MVSRRWPDYLRFLRFRSGGHLRSLVCETFVFEPLFGGVDVGADEEDFLDGAGADVEAFEAGFGGVLDFEAGGCFAAAGFDSAWDDAGDVGAAFDDVVQQIVEALDAAVLAFDSAELHIAPQTERDKEFAAEAQSHGEEKTKLPQMTGR